MKISTKGRYALRMMLDIAVHQGEGYVALKDTAQREEISKKYLEQIALQLTQAGLLRAVRGHQGGYRLLKAPQEYTVYQILCVTEGSLAPVACLEHAPNACPRSGQCPTLPLWQGLEDVVNKADIEMLANGILLVGILGSALITVPFNCLSTIVSDREKKIDYFVNRL